MRSIRHWRLLAVALAAMVGRGLAETAPFRAVSPLRRVVPSPDVAGVSKAQTDLPSVSSVAVTRGGAAAAAAPSGLAHTLKVGFYFGLWYILNIYYNIVNKKLLNVVPAPLVIGSIQLGIGSLYVGLLWLLRLRAAPTLASPQAVQQFRNVGLWHALGQEASMLSFSAGAVSFTHIVKALEPFFSALVSALAFGKWMPLPVYATLLPVVGGVGYACLQERAFSWLAFWSAMASNVAFALRAVMSKVAMGTAGKSGKNLTSPNVFAVVTIFAFLLSIPMAALGEGAGFGALWQKALRTTSQPQLMRAVLVSGLFHYLNNEVMYLALGNVHPVTLAVGNTMKRVFIILASVLVFRNPVSLQAGIGSAIGIGGVLLYSLVKQHYEALEAGGKLKAAKLKVAKKKVVKKVTKQVAAKKAAVKAAVRKVK